MRFCVLTRARRISRGVTSRFQLFCITRMVIPITLCLLLQPARRWTIFDAAVIPDMEVSHGPLTHHDPVNQSQVTRRWVRVRPRQTWVMTTLVPGLEKRIMYGSEEETLHIAGLVWFSTSSGKLPTIYP
jgi:hypothetical protein